MENFITRSEYVEHNKRMEDEHARQNHRIQILEDAVKSNNALTIAVEKMAINMENMLTEQKEQGKRLKVLESRDGEMWRKVTGHILTTVLGIVLGYIVTSIGL